MALGNGLVALDDLGNRIREYIDNIKFLTSEIKQKIGDIGSTQETLEELRSEGLITSDLEASFSNVIQKSLDEKSALEEKRETIKEAASQEMNDAKEKYDKAVEGINSSAGSQASEVLSSIRERVIEIGEWEKELQDAMDTNNS